MTLVPKKSATIHGVLNYAPSILMAFEIPLKKRLKKCLNC